MNCNKSQNDIIKKRLNTEGSVSFNDYQAINLKNNWRQQYSDIHRQL
jgi:hypothetical protein